MIRLLASMVASLMLAIGFAEAQTFTVPSLKAPVNDYAGMIAAGAQEQINQALRAIKDAGGTQIAVLTIPTLSGLTIEQASIQVVDAWKLGTSQKDNGILLLIVRDERQMRIEVGQGAEGDLTDAHTKRIIDETMVPLFKVGNISEGVLLGVYQIAKLANPNMQVDPYFNTKTQWRPERNRSLDSTDIIVIILFICFFVFIKLLGGGGGRRGRRSGWGTGYMGSSGGFGGRSGGFGSGGGFSGGGGGFSGGGASGRW